jgi:ABC-2 type transport system permease protein
MLNRIWTLARKDLTQFARDRALALFIIFGPMLELVLVAQATSAGIAHLPTAVLDQDRTTESRALVTALRNTETFEMTSPPETADDIADAMDRDAIMVGIVIPDGFGADLTDPNTPQPQVQILVDGSEPAAADTAIRTAQALVASYGAAAVASSTVAGAEAFPQVMDARLRVRFNEELKESNYTVPSEMGFMLAAITVMVAALGIARERELGTLEQLTVTPLRSTELVIGKAIPAIVISYVVFLMMLGVSLVVFHVPMRGSWPLLLAVAAFYLFVELGWGIMASAVSATQLQALLLVFVFIMVEIVFSGYAFPVENMPPALQVVSNLFPIKHWLIIFRSILLKGAGPSVFWRELVALAILGVGVMGAAVLVLRRNRLG